MAKRLSELIVEVPDIVHVTSDTTVTAPVVELDVDLQLGGVFVARRGLSVDGHDFIPRAIEKGAAAIVGEKDIRNLPVPYVQVEKAQELTGYLAAAYHDYPSRKLVIVGVTGTDGKTTTSTLIHSILRVATGGEAGLISTVNAVIGGQTLDTGLHVTTPSAPRVQSLLAQMVANGLTHAILEMTSHGLAQGRLNGVDIDVAVLTNLTHEHLDYHGSFEAYRAAKGRMFQMLSASYRKPNHPKVSVINADDPNADYFTAFPADDIAFYGLGERALFRGQDIRYEPDGTYFRMKMADPTQYEEFFTPLLGQFNVMNCLAAWTASLYAYLCLGPTNQIDGIRAVKAIPGRMERINEGQNFTAIVDFAHTPNALANALKTCHAMLQPGKRLITVFGCAGLRDREKRRLMPEAAAELADFTVLTAEDPRTELLDDILQVMADAMMTKGGVDGQTFIRVPDRGEALHRACQMAREGDIVIACGKGHEQSMCFGQVEYPWDDREALRAALRGAPLKTLPTS